MISTMMKSETRSPTSVAISSLVSGGLFRSGIDKRRVNQSAQYQVHGPLFMDIAIVYQIVIPNDFGLVWNGFLHDLLHLLKRVGGGRR